MPDSELPTTEQQNTGRKEGRRGFGPNAGRRVFGPKDAIFEAKTALFDPQSPVELNEQGESASPAPGKVKSPRGEGFSGKEKTLTFVARSASFSGFLR